MPKIFNLDAQQVRHLRHHGLVNGDAAQAALGLDPRTVRHLRHHRPDLMRARGGTHNENIGKKYENMVTQVTQWYLDRIARYEELRRPPAFTLVGSPHGVAPGNRPPIADGRRGNAIAARG